MSEQPPDFAMARAVEILASIYERQRKEADVPPPPFDKPIVIFNEALALDVTRTTRADVEKALGLGFLYPSLGWQTYCVRGAERTREFLSIFYSQDHLAAAELYLPRNTSAPSLEPRNLGRFRFVPGELMLGMPTTSLPENFGRIAGVAETVGPYDELYEARFPGGAAYCMGNGGAIERLALYVLKDAPKAKGA